jgi:hypothetical protein
VAAKLTETRIDHDGVRRNAAKRFSVRKLGSLERARAEATAYRQAAIEMARRGELVLRPDTAADHQSRPAVQDRGDYPLGRTSLYTFPVVPVGPVWSVVRTYISPARSWPKPST